MDREPDGVGDDLRVTRDLVVPATDLQWRFSRAGGPGGQGVNTTDSRVELSLDLATLPERHRDRARSRLAGRVRGDVLTVVAADDRSQLRNRRAARARLAALLRDALAPDPPARRPSSPSRAQRRRRLEDKRRQAVRKSERRRPPTE